MPIKGLPNIGLSCYINSVLQAFFYIDEFRQFVLTTEFIPKDSFVFYLQCIFGNLSNRFDTNNSQDREELEIVFQIFKSLCERFKESQQGDANHFVSYILNKLDSEIIKNHRRISGDLADSVHLTSIITDLFKGEQEDRVICEKCNDTEKWKTKQSFFALPLVVDKNENMPIDKLLMDFMGISFIQNGKCRDCSGELYKHTNVVRWPPYLIINLCRVCSDGRGQLMKVNTNVTVQNHKLIVADNSHLYDIEYHGNTENIEYRLQATVNHHGDAHQGHYTCISNTDFSWIEFNDLRVASVQESDVVSHSNSLLFFKKVPASPMTTNR